MVGKSVSHYKILEKIGSGGMGVVYKALDTRLDRAVALKFLPSHLSINKEEKKRFIHEAKAPAGDEFDILTHFYPATAPALVGNQSKKSHPGINRGLGLIA